MIAIAMLDFPHPDSPTNPTRSPGAMDSEKSVTAETTRPGARYETDKFWISRTGVTI
jgi:hypothetical protein